MKTIQVQLDELLVTVREFTLDSYPEAQTALEGTVSGDKTQRRDAIRSLLKECTDVAEEKMGTISVRQVALVSAPIMEATGFKKKDEAPVTEAPESPTPIA